MEEPARSRPSNKLLVIGVVLLVILAAFAGRAYTEHQFRVVYSRDLHKNDQELISLIDNAHSYIYFAIYTFTKSDIADALVKAKKRGVTVEGIMDKSQAAESFESSVIAELTAAGIPLETEVHTDGIMHIKALVTENAYASGSYNWTASATESNDEFLEIGTDRYVHDQYLALIKKIIAANKAGAFASAPAAGAASGAGVIQGTYDYTEAKDHIGEYAAVTGRVVKVYKSKNGTTFFDYCTKYAGCPFSAVVFSSDLSKFTDISQYQGQTITIAGDISSYQGTAEIILSDPGQISENTGN
jgi:hypothetical protein